MLYRLITAYIVIVLLLLAGFNRVNAKDIDKNKEGSYVYIIQGVTRYCLSYYGEEHLCEGHVIFPKDNYKELSSWCIDSSHVGSISKYDNFRISARLATIDDKVERGFSLNPDAFGFWSEYSWGIHASDAFYSITDNIKNDPRIYKMLVNPLIDIGVASPDSKMIIRIHEENKLSKKQKKQLVEIFKAVELEFIGHPELTIKNKINNSGKYRIDK